MISPENINTLQSSGIIDAYEYVLRKLIDEYLPNNNVYEKCAFFLLEYQTKISEQNIRAKGIEKFIQLTTEQNENSLSIHSVKEIIPNFPVTLKSKILYQKESSSSVESRKLLSMTIDDLIQNKLQLASKKVTDDYSKKAVKYGNYDEYTRIENDNVRKHIFKTCPEFTDYQFVPIEDIQKMNAENNKNQNEQNKTQSNISRVSDRKIMKVSKDFVEGVLIDSKKPKEETN